MPTRRLAAGEVLARSEVHEDDAAAAFAHDVLRFDVAMEEARAVHRCRARTDIEAHERGFARAKRPAALDHLLERLAAHELRPQADAAVVFLGAVDLDDVLVAQACQPPRFVHQPLACLAIGHHTRSPVRALSLDTVVVKQLQRDVAMQLRIPRAINVA